jgi:hypothetical protein
MDGASAFAVATHAIRARLPARSQRTVHTTINYVIEIINLMKTLLKTLY